MHVVSGPIGRERVHFEAPAAARLPVEMDAFLGWFATSQAARAAACAAMPPAQPISQEDQAYLT